MGNNQGTNVILLSKPTKLDGAALAALINQCPPLEPNTTYAYLLFCTHFADTCILARDAAGVVGAIVAYRPPSHPEALFVWQIAVHERARGMGLGRRMLDSLMERVTADGVTHLEATVSSDNRASNRLFTRFSESNLLPCTLSPYFEATLFGSGDHEPEHLYRIGPITNKRKDS